MCQSKAEGGKRCYKPLSYRSLFSDKQLNEMLSQRMIFRSVHSTLPLAVWKYSKAAVISQTWNDVTMNCRGLVIDTETGEVLARPFGKFFNYSEPSCPELDWDQEGIVAMNKEDGSLCIYVEKYDLLATPGSAESAQALAATRMLKEQYANQFEPVKGRTYMFEFIHPENRIVLDYGDRKELILLGATNTKTGEPIDVDDIPEWTGPKVEKIPANTLREAIALPPRPNAEGIVVRFPDGTMTKIKQDDYISLHRTLSNLSPKYIWESMMAEQMKSAGIDSDRIVRAGIPERHVASVAEHGDAMTSIKDVMPEEWYDWIEERHSEIKTAFNAEMGRIYEMRDSIPENLGQKERAAYVQSNFERSDWGYLMPPRFNEPMSKVNVLKKLRPTGTDPEMAFGVMGDEDEA